MWLTVRWVAVGRYAVVGKFPTRLCAIRGAGRELGVLPHHGGVNPELVALEPPQGQSPLFVPWPAVPRTRKTTAVRAKVGNI